MTVTPLSPYDLAAAVRAIAAKIPTGTPKAIDVVLASMHEQYPARFEPKEVSDLANRAIFPPPLCGEYTWYRR